MTDPQDFQKMLQDAAASLRLDPDAVREVFRRQAGLGEEASKVALAAAEKSAELSAEFARATLAAMSEASRARDLPADYGKAMQEFASGQSALVQKQMAAFAQVVREAQAQTLELVMQAARKAQSPGR